MVGARPASRAEEKAALDRRQIVASVKNAAVFGAYRLRAVGGIVFAAASAFEARQHGDAEFSTAQSIPTLAWARVRAQASDHRQSSCALTLLVEPALAGWDRALFSIRNKIRRCSAERRWGWVAWDGKLIAVEGFGKCGGRGGFL